MRNKVVILMLGVLLCCGGLTQAIDIDFNSVNPVGTIQNSDNYDQVTLHDSAIVTMMGGSAQSVLSYNSSIFQFQNGTVFGFISVCDTSSLTMSGGSVPGLQVYDSSITNLTGGNITGSLAIYSTGAGTAVVNIYGKNLNSIPDHRGGMSIVGNWGDAASSPFAIWCRGYSGPTPGSPDSPIIFHTVPEPLTVSLLAFGCSLIRCKRKTWD